MPTITFRCSDCKWTADRRVSFSASGGMRCPSCGSVAERLSVYRINVNGFASTPSGERDYSQSFKDAQEAGAEIEYQHERLRDATQIENLKPPPLYQMAKAKAMDLAAKGATVEDL